MAPGYRYLPRTTTRELKDIGARLYIPGISKQKLPLPPLQIISGMPKKIPESGPSQSIQAIEHSAGALDW